MKAHQAEKVITLFCVFLVLLVLILVPFEISSILEDKTTYVQIHHLDTNQKNWEFQLLMPLFLLAIGGLVALGIMLINLFRKENNWLLWLNRITISIVFFLFIASLVISGFDH